MVVRGTDPDTHRSRGGPGHDLLFAGRTRTRASHRSRDGPGDDSLQDRPGFLLFAGRTRTQASSRDGPGFTSFTGRTRTRSFVRGTDPDTSFLTGKTCEDETSASARCSTSWPQACHPRSPGGLPLAWRRELPGKGLPTSVRACSILSRTGSGVGQGLLPQASGNGRDGCDSGVVLAGSERIAQLPGNESPRGSTSSTRFSSWVASS